MTEKLMSTKEVADYLGVTERTVFNYLNAGKLTARKIGKSWRFDPEDVRSFVEQQPTSDSASNA